MVGTNESALPVYSDDDSDDDILAVSATATTKSKDTARVESSDTNTRTHTRDESDDDDAKLSARNGRKSEVHSESVKTSVEAVSQTRDSDESNMDDRADERSNRVDGEEKKTSEGDEVVRTVRVRRPPNPQRTLANINQRVRSLERLLKSLAVERTNLENPLERGKKRSRTDVAVVVGEAGEGEGGRDDRTVADSEKKQSDDGEPPRKVRSLVVGNLDLGIEEPAVKDVRRPIETKVDPELANKRRQEDREKRAQERKAAAERQTAGGKVVSASRNKRMMGMLMGSLGGRVRRRNEERTRKAAAKQDAALKKVEENIDSGVVAKFEETLKGVEERETKAREELEKLREQAAELKSEIDEKRRNELRNALSPFILTKAGPPITFLPKEHNASTKQALEDSQASLQTFITKRHEHGLAMTF